MEYGHECMRPSGEYTKIPQVAEKPCTVTVTRPCTYNVVNFCPGKPDFTQTTMRISNKKPISVIPIETGVNVTGNKRWQMPIQLENVTEPERIHVKVDPIFRTLQIAGKPTVTGENVAFKRVLPLPENIDINQLKSVLTPEGILMFNAPFMAHNPLEQEGRFNAPRATVNEMTPRITVPQWTGMTEQEECDNDVTLPLNFREQPCTMKFTHPCTHCVGGICPGKPEFVKKPICVIPIETGVNVTENKLWQMPIQLENVTEPERIHVKVDPIFRTLQITGKPTVTGKNVAFKRVLPLPENIDINQLKSVLTPEGILMFNAPFMVNNPLEQEGRFNAPRATVNEMTPRITDPQWTGMTQNEECNTDLPLPEYLRLLKTVTLSHGTQNQVECVKDTTTGAWKIILNMDTLGFDPKNIQVLFHGKGRRLAVIGKRHLPGFGSNVFQREFHVPEYLDVNQMQWRVMNNGLVRIEMPCQGGKIPMEGKFMRNIPCTDY